MPGSENQDVTGRRWTQGAALFPKMSAEDICPRQALGPRTGGGRKQAAPSWVDSFWERQLL